MTSPINLDIEDFPKDFNFDNGQYPPLDALTYWHFLKKSKTVIEVGCGFSTYLPFKMGKNLTAIDPSPRTLYYGINYIKKYVQDIPLNFFLTLVENDILFIDSSHIYEDGSDVQYLIEAILPKLNKGVLIHFHDYFDIDGYPEDWKTYPHMAVWNENDYIFKIKNEYEILAINHLICKKNNEYLKKQYPFVPENITRNFGAVKGASIWLKK
jgi:hypothetical protein